MLQMLKRPRLLVAYHFFYPDDVVSARHFADLATEQSSRGWDVTVLTSNRSRNDVSKSYPHRERWEGIDVVRAYRPAWNQSVGVLRLVNSAWMLIAWLALAIKMPAFDAVIIGSDPAFAPLLVPLLRILWPRVAILHWCFDLYPEAIAAEGTRKVAPFLAPIAAALMRWAYRYCRVLVDLGPRMRRRLLEYKPNTRHATLVPWALIEPGVARPPDPVVRKQLFPDARLALLYSGTMGRAHDYSSILELARACRNRSGNDIAFCFSCRGNRAGELRAAVAPSDTNVRFAPFCDEATLQTRLESADLHIMTLRPEWSGVVVPSKFFGSLAVGRPVLYSGPPDSDIACWIREHNLGLILSERNVDEVVDALHRLRDRPMELVSWQTNALQVYYERFSRRVVNDHWSHLLQSTVAR